MVTRLMKTLAVLVALACLLLLAGVLAYRDTPAAQVDARWGTAPSRFLQVDGVRVHYRDEGEGPVIVLLHANYASLLMWEPWAAALKDRFRVIRLDMTAHGLTGVDPSGDYSLERTRWAAPWRCITPCAIPGGSGS